MFRSCAEWPKEVYTNEYGTHVSTDEHSSEESAEAICRMLKRDGFGGKAKHFPIRTWVEKVEEDNKCLGASTCGGCVGKECPANNN